MAKRLGHGGSGRCALGPSPAQMSELSGLGKSRGFCVLYFYNRLLLGRLPDTKLAPKKEGANLARSTKERFAQRYCLFYKVLEVSPD